MWHQYHSLCIFVSFKRKWTQFIQTSTQQPADPSFYQHVSDIVFDELIKQKFPLQKKANMPKDTAISNEEANVIYAAGYTLHTVKKKVGTSAHCLKEEIVACIMDLLADEEDIEEEEVVAEWVRAVDRGLWHIKLGTFFLFCAIEEELRSYLKVSRVKEISDGAKMEIVGAIIRNDVAFYWSMLCTGAGDNKDELLSRIVDLWVTI